MGQNRKNDSSKTSCISSQKYTQTAEGRPAAVSPTTAAKTPIYTSSIVRDPSTIHRKDTPESYADSNPISTRQILLHPPLHPGQEHH
jgi:hypothetical protein